MADPGPEPGWVRIEVTDWATAERLTAAGIMSRSRWEDWVDAVTGHGGTWPGYVDVKEDRQQGAREDPDAPADHPTELS